jgi:hypothetical protein
MDYSNLPPGFLGPDGPIANIMKNAGTDPNMFRVNSKMEPQNDINLEMFSLLFSPGVVAEYQRAVKAGVPPAMVIPLQEGPHFASRDKKCPEHPIQLQSCIVGIKMACAYHSFPRHSRLSPLATWRSRTTSSTFLLILSCPASTAPSCAARTTRAPRPTWK